jgi:uncharacterized membrane protein YkvA (DUF1232 family)
MITRQGLLIFVFLRATQEHRAAELFVARVVAYAVSQIDLIPDFVPVDVIIWLAISALCIVWACGICVMKWYTHPSM